jgi:UDP-N-acetylglucosamine--N-acetylmuramyl-(pentapeptide) pyrophosphoryl-undecaprenol N-acetylglucosamine transferase
MRIVLTGGGTGGHFYPLIAVTEELQKEINAQKILDAHFFYVADKPYDSEALYKLGIEYVEVPTGKLRLYFSFQNFIDVFKTGIALFRALFALYKIYPDVIFSKGGYSAFPVVVAGWILRIPIIIHESDTVPGRVNKITAHLATRIAIGFPEAIKHFNPEITALVGNPVRKEIQQPTTDGAYDYFKIDPSIPVITILGGSQGAQKINDAILAILPSLVEKYQIIHQVGMKFVDETENISQSILKDSNYKERYKAYGFFGELQQKMLAGISKLIITRAGASSIFEIAMWGIPSITIPIAKSNGNHQFENAYSYAHTGATEVIEESNLVPHVFEAEIDRIMNTPDVQSKMKQATKSFVFPNAAHTIAKEIIAIALTHEEK